jgi:HD-GYP domain-containing protein (c-di-GMP phosphodiesterase class II)
VPASGDRWRRATPADTPSRWSARRTTSRLHTLVTDQLLRRLPFTAPLAAVACSAHERLDDSGYHRRSTSGQLDIEQRALAAADCYQAMVSDRPHRAALSPQDAATALRKMANDGGLDGEAVERVLLVS